MTLYLWSIYTRAKRYSPIRLPSRLEILLAQFQEWCPDKSPSNVVYCRCAGATEAVCALDLFECLLNALAVGAVGADADSLAAGLVDFID